MKKSIVRVQQDGLDHHIKVTLEGDPCEAFTPDGRANQLKFLSEVVQTPALLVCGPWPYQNLKMFHNGTRWIIELTADRPQV